MKNILVFGDSNTWGYDVTTYDPEIGAGRRLAFDERWPGIVQNNLGSEYRIIVNMLGDVYGYVASVALGPSLLPEIASHLGNTFNLGS